MIRAKIKDRLQSYGCPDSKIKNEVAFFLNLFKDLVDKLEVIGDEEMGKVKFDMGSPWGLVDRATVGNAIAKAQLQSDRDKLKEQINV